MSIVRRISKLLSGAVVVFATSGVLHAYRASEVTVSYASGTSPTLILGLDNNLEVCLALAKPATVEELRGRGIAMTESQRVLLLAFSLIKRTEGERYECQVPVFRGKLAVQMRRDADDIAGRLAESASASRAAFDKAVRAAGLGENAYSLLGSLVLDHLVWAEFERQGLLASADPSTMKTGSPLWSGYAWIVLPPAPAKVGTDSSSLDKSELFVTWTPDSLKASEALSNAAKHAVLLAANGGELSAAERELLTRLDLWKSGGSRIATIAADSPVYLAARDLASEIAQTFASAFDFPRFARYSGVPDRSKDTLIVWHEIFPRLLKRLARGGAAEPPVLIDGTGSLRSAMFVVRHP